MTSQISWFFMSCSVKDCAWRLSLKIIPVISNVWTVISNTENKAGRYVGKPSSPSQGLKSTSSRKDRFYPHNYWLKLIISWRSPVMKNLQLCFTNNPRTSLSLSQGFLFFLFFFIKCLSPLVFPLWWTDNFLSF